MKTSPSSAGEARPAPPLLDVEGVVLLPASVDALARAAPQDEEPVPELAQVAGAQPAVVGDGGGGGARVLPVAAGQVGGERSRGGDQIIQPVGPRGSGLDQVREEGRDDGGRPGAGGVQRGEVAGRVEGGVQGERRAGEVGAEQ